MYCIMRGFLKALNRCHRFFDALILIVVNASRPEKSIISFYYNWIFFVREDVYTMRS